MAEIVWRPTPESAAASNVGRFMAEHSFSGCADLRARSIADPEWFWDAFVQFVEIEWSTPYTKVLDTSAGIEWGAVALGDPPGDLSGLEDPAALDAIMGAR